jgi:hypothetical protein
MVGNHDNQFKKKLRLNTMSAQKAFRRNASNDISIVLTPDFLNDFS